MRESRATLFAQTMDDLAMSKTYAASELSSAIRNELEEVRRAIRGGDLDKARRRTGDLETKMKRALNYIQMIPD